MEGLDMVPILFFLLISEALIQNSKYAELKPFFLSTLLSS